jgi:predicted MFS family arabinose efflux permease
MRPATSRAATTSSAQPDENHATAGERSMHLIILLSMTIHACYIGSKVVVSLLALDLGASQLTVGMLATLYAVVPLALGVYSGRLADTSGMRLPLNIGAVAMCAAMLAGYFSGSLAGLIVVPILVGTGFVFFNVSIQNLTGGWGRPEDRPRNFALLAMGYSGSVFIGPMVAGFSIDYLGYGAAFLFFAAFALVPLAVLAGNPTLPGAVKPPSRKETGSTFALLRDPPLRRLIVTSGLCVASSELYSFYLPVFAHSIGLPASTIGIILGAYAAAVFASRFMLPMLLARLRPNQIMFAFMLTAALAFAGLPLLHNVYALIALSLVIGWGMGIALPLLMSVSYERSPAGRTGEVTGLRLTINNIARVSIPLISGALGTVFGAGPVFWLNAVNLLYISWMSRR